MRIEQLSIPEFIGGNDTVFSIPLFQRPYSWDEPQCFSLFSDTLRACKNNKDHFLGLILFKEKEDTSTSAVDLRELSVIDGQQRLLTVFLLLSAFDQYMREICSGRQDVSPTEFASLRNVVASCLRISGAAKGAGFESRGENAAAGDEDTGKGWKISPTSRDRDAYFGALENDVSNLEMTNCAKAKPSSKNRAIHNKAFFLSKLRESNIDPYAFWKGLCRLSIVAVELGVEDDAQTIFESFNSKGVSLVTADLVRNYLLMAQDLASQTRLYTDYWEPIQDLFGDDPGSLRLNGAIRAWTTIRCKEARTKSDRETFDVFKRYCETEFDGTVEDILDELYGFCCVWAENYRYHAVKKFRSSNWSKLGRKTLVSGVERVEPSKESWDFYVKHYGICSK